MQNEADREVMDEIYSGSSPERGSTHRSGQDSSSDRPEELDVEGEHGPATEDHDLSTLSNFEKVVVIHLQRLYDVQLAFLTLADKDMGSYIASLHSNGEFFGPDPAILLD